MPAASVSDKTFGQEVLSASVPVLVEFTAEHAPTNVALDELAAGTADTVKVVKVDVHRNPSLKEEYGVRGLPTLMLFKYGKPIARRVGGHLSKAELYEWIDGALVLALATRKNTAIRSVTDFSLPNGMQVVVIPDDIAPVVTHMLWYKVGSSDEPKGLSGLSRLLAHLSGKSLDKIADGDFFKFVSRLGGVTNASTYRDASVYWQRVPRDHLKTVMGMEADRMVNLRLTDDDIATERAVLLDHRRSSIDNEPLSRLGEAMRASLYRAHPYGLPVLGLAKDIALLSREDVESFHKQHYVPQKAVLVVSGEVTAAEVEHLARDTYGRVPADPHVLKGGGARAPAQIAPRRIAVVDRLGEKAHFGRSYAVPGMKVTAQAEMPALTVLSAILGSGLASRLYQKLVVERKIASTASAVYLNNALEAGELAIFAVATDGDLRAIEAAVDEVLDDIRSGAVSLEELARAKRSLIASHVYRSNDQFALPNQYGWAVVAGRPIQDVDDWPAAVARVTSADIQKVVAAYIVEGRSVTGWLSPRGARKDARKASALAAPSSAR